MEIVVRNIGEVRLNEQPESRLVEGYALVFNTRSQYMGFYEEILPTAVTQELIDNCDIFALFNHDDNKVLARSEYGNGTLHLEVDEYGLKYSFEAPKTALGDELLEHLKRGDMHQSSFAFGIDYNDAEMVEQSYVDGEKYYTIKSIPVLFDVSPVWTPAYNETTVVSVSKRAKELCERINTKINDNDDMKEQELNELKDKVQQVEDVLNSLREFLNEDAEENKEEDKENEVKEEAKEEDTPNEEMKDEDNEEKPDEEESENEDDNETSKQRNKQNNINIMKEQKFSLIKAIRSVANNQEMDEATKAVVEAGTKEMRSAGLSYGGQIQIPVSCEERSVTVTGTHDDLVVTEFTNILEPLRSKNVLVEAGAKFMSGLVGDVQVPMMSAENVGWAGEIEDAVDGSGTFSHVTLSPKRLTAYIDVSKQFLVQDSLDAEALIRQDLINAINSKLEATILSTDAGTVSKPAGIFNGKTATSIASFANLTALEATVETENIFGDYKYVVAPSAKAVLRAMSKSTKNTQLVMEGNNIDGTDVLSTTHMASNTLSFGCWNNVVIGQWGAIDLIVDPYTVAKSGCVRIVINAYFDAKLLRDGAIAYGTTAS